jgi:hypothetical protein
VWDLPTTVGQKFIQAFQARLVEQTTESWEFWYGLLETYEGREGHAGVPARHIESDFNLGSWVTTQRSLWRVGRLSPERIARLEAVSGWIWHPFEVAWDVGFGALESFVAREGHANVPALHSEGDFNLGTWVQNQRTSLKKGRLSQDRIARLDAVAGWVWDLFDTAWEEGYECLRSYVSREGHARVPTRHKEDDYSLGKWVTHQRTDWKAGRVSPDRIARLEALPGWVWDTVDAAWEEGFESLQAFVEREGHARVSARRRERDFSLGSWVSNQKKVWMEGDLSADRIARLEALPGWVWDTLGAQWEKAFESLQTFLEREGHTRVHAEHTEGDYKLGNWVANQRRDWLRGDMSPTRIARLEALPGWVWDPLQTAWEKGYQSLQTFVSREGHARVPTKHKEGDYNLGKWVSHQRNNRDKGRLTSDNIARLEALPGWVWDPLQTAWEKGYQSLQVFVAREGHARVPNKHVEGNFKIGSWITNQKTALRKGRLSPDRVARLQALPGWVWDQEEARWEEAFDRLQSFARREGHARVLADYREGDFALGPWVQRQRRAWKTGRLAPDRAVRLEALPGWVWDAPIGRPSLAKLLDEHRRKKKGDDE